MWIATFSANFIADVCEDFPRATSFYIHIIKMSHAIQPIKYIQMSVNVFDFMVIQNILSFCVVRLIKHNLLIVFFAVCGVCLIPTCALQYNKEYA
jgi:hypothetical protein